MFYTYSVPKRSINTSYWSYITNIILLGPLYSLEQRKQILVYVWENMV
jgi:hypothetical protein